MAMPPRNGGSLRFNAAYSRKGLFTRRRIGRAGEAAKHHAEAEARKLGGDEIVNGAGYCPCNGSTRARASRSICRLGRSVTSRRMRIGSRAW